MSRFNGAEWLNRAKRRFLWRAKRIAPYCKHAQTNADRYLRRHCCCSFKPRVRWFNRGNRQGTQNSIAPKNASETSALAGFSRPISFRRGRARKALSVAETARNQRSKLGPQGVQRRRDYPQGGACSASATESRRL